MTVAMEPHRFPSCCCIEILTQNHFLLHKIDLQARQNEFAWGTEFTEPPGEFFRFLVFR